jgi:hypothetical protein
MGWTSIENVELYLCVPRRFQGVAPRNRKKSVRMYMKNICDSFALYVRLYLLVTNTSNRLLYTLCSAYQVFVRCLWTKVKDLTIFGRAITQAISRRAVATETLILLRARLCGICGGQIWVGTSLSPSVSVFLCHCRATDVPLSMY